MTPDGGHLTLEALSDRQRIGDVVKRLARGTDRLDRALMILCYHPDGFDDHNAFRGSAPEFADWVCEVLAMYVATHHVVADPLIRLDGDVAHVDTYCEAHHVGVDSDMVLGLRYLDRFERRAGEWRIARRVCAFDWTYTVPFDPAHRIPFHDDYTVGRRDGGDPGYRDV